MNFQNFETVQAPLRKAQPPPVPVALRFSHTDLFGEKVKWLPPYRLAPSFASADGQSIIYRRRSQVVLAGESGETHVNQATSFALGAGDTRVRIDAHGYARIVRPTRSSQAIDPVSNVVDGAADMERGAALTVCSHLNEHVESLAFPHRWTPSPDQVLLPVAARAFAEPKPRPPRASISKDPRVKAAADPQELNDYLDVRADWLARRLVWDAAQRSIYELKEKAERGNLDAMRGYLTKCLHDVLWPLPTIISYEFNGQHEASLEFVVPGLDAIPDREASMASGNRVEIRRMSDVSHTKLHNQHALGLVVRLLGELFASLPTIEYVTVSALQIPGNGKAQRYIASAEAERSRWSSLHSNGSVTADQAIRCLGQLGARCNLTALGAFLAVEPFN
ncbi:MAG TPA: hypothetical protein VNA44_02005 [Burkholderiaceae bacterium]|nr:hypothetical protein [Burkholderiaceae bacterium]